MKLKLIEKREVTRVVEGKENRQLESSSYRIIDENNSEVGYANIGQNYYGLSMHNKTITVEELTKIINNL